MAKFKQVTRIIFVKVVALVLAAVTAGLGVNSHYRSDWVNQETSVRVPPKLDIVKMTLYEICELECAPWIPCSNCPSISMEQLFVGVIIICAIVSFLSLVTECLADSDSRVLLKLDVGYHALAAVFLIISGVMHITSAKMIEESFPGLENSQLSNKIAAGSFAIVQALVYGGVAIILIKSALLIVHTTFTNAS